MKQSAGILLYKYEEKELKIFLVHPGGPFWARKDEGAWTIPKGEFTDEEEPLTAAKREFKEETGSEVKGKFIALKTVRFKNGKYVHAWAVEGDIDASAIESNTFEIEWPPRSGKVQTFPEVDRADWFDTEEAMKKIHPVQSAFIEELLNTIKKI